MAKKTSLKQEENLEQDVAHMRDPTTDGKRMRIRGGDIEERIDIHHVCKCIIYNEQSRREEQTEAMNQQGERYLITFLFLGSLSQWKHI